MSLPEKIIRKRTLRRVSPKESKLIPGMLYYVVGKTYVMVNKKGEIALYEEVEEIERAKGK